MLLLLLPGTGSSGTGGSGDGAHVVVGTQANRGVQGDCRQIGEWLAGVSTWVGTGQRGRGKCAAPGCRGAVADMGQAHRQGIGDLNDAGVHPSPAGCLQRECHRRSNRDRTGWAGALGKCRCRLRRARSPGRYCL